MKTHNRYMLLAAMVGMAATATAQDSYDAQNFTNSDLNGTARFVSMGGALGALGGDISVMSTNPAGTGLYRNNDGAFTIGGLFTDEGALGHDRSRMSIDQGGILMTFDNDNPTSKGLQFVNFGLNYQKKRNFLGNQMTDIQHLDGIFSQTFQIADLCNSASYYGAWGILADMSASNPERHPVGILSETQMQDEEGKAYTWYEGIGAQKAYYAKATYGGHTQADLNLSFNVSDQFFFGASVGVYDIDYNRESFYQETGNDYAFYDFSNWYKTTGDGIDVKLGFICRPIEDSPFRFGVSIHTPIWYRMTDANGADLFLNDERVYSLSNEEYDYNFRTPWKFGLSLGHTVGKSFAIGAEYEYQDLSTAKYTGIDGTDDTYFRYTNDVTEKTLRGQHTLKLGAEFKPTDALSLRIGYNYVSSPFKKDAFRTILYDGIYTETDYTNWGDTNRFTFGVGYRYKGGYIDLAYQYQAQKGDFYAFDDVNLKSTEINANRSQLMATFGFRF